MTALLIIRRGGDIVGSCDASCYEAKNRRCECVCGGKNHRAGLAAAIANTRDLAEEWVARARQAGEQIDSWEQTVPIVNDGLFPPAVLLEEPPPVPGPLEFHRDRPMPSWPADLTATEEPLF